MEPLLQIAGVRDQAEAELLRDAGVTHVGFPLRLPDGREDLAEQEAKAIIALLRPSVCPVLITYFDDPAEIVACCDYLGVGGLQLHGSITASALARIRSQRPTLFLSKSLVVRDNNLSELRVLMDEVHQYVDAFITDTFDPSTGRSGATGKTHDWSASRQLVERSPKPVILAGGLTPENVWEAIMRVGPAGVDSHTGVERADGRKDPELVRSFLSRAKEAFRLLQAGKG